MTLKWSPPAKDGGCPVKGYIVEKRDTFKRVYTQVGKTAMCEFRVPRLVAGNEYVFQVSAENEVGVGEAAEVSQGLDARTAFGELSAFIALCPHTISPVTFVCDITKTSSA